MSQFVDCSTHGRQLATLVCRHLVQHKGQGFHYAHSNEEPDLWFPDAWCDACDGRRLREGGWTDNVRDQAGWQVLCASCYSTSRELNWPDDSKQMTEALVERAQTYVETTNRNSRARFSMEGYERWEWDRESARILFTGKTLRPLAADCQTVGTFSSDGQSWMWSWANEAFPERLTAKVRRVRRYGEERRLLPLACALWPAEPRDGERMQAVTAFLLKAEGVFTFEEEGLVTYVTLKGFNLDQALHDRRAPS